MSPVFDTAFLELNLDELREPGQEKHLTNFKRATICSLATSPLTANSILSQRQFIHISYDPRLPKNNGPQTQFRCTLLCPAMTQNPDEYNRVLLNLFERCLLSNARRIMTERPDITLLCHKPLKDTYLPKNFFQDTTNETNKYFTPMIGGTRRVAISYEATTFPGDSGAPVFWHDESQDLIEVVAIHMAGDSLEYATPFSAERCAYATPTFLIHPEDLRKYTAN